MTSYDFTGPDKSLSKRMGLKLDPITARGHVDGALWSRYHWHTFVGGQTLPHEVTNGRWEKNEATGDTCGNEAV